MMSKNTKVTEAEKQEMIAGFESGMTLRDIGRTMERSPSTVAVVLEEKGVRQIVGYGSRPRRKTVICTNCRATGHNKGAKFCYRCGADIRTESDILRERLGKLISDLQFLPESVKDNAYAVIQDTIDYLRKV